MSRNISALNDGFHPIRMRVPLPAGGFEDTPNQAGLDKLDEEGLCFGSATLDASG